jgi:hypothetical protein
MRFGQDTAGKPCAVDNNPCALKNLPSVRWLFSARVTRGSLSAAVSCAQECQRLSWAAVNQAMGHYLHGCANLAVTRTPQQALAALQATQTSLLSRLSVTFAEATRLWRKPCRFLFGNDAALAEIAAAMWTGNCADRWRFAGGVPR